MLNNKTLLAAGLGAVAALTTAPQISLADPIACPAAQPGAPRADQAVTINPRRNINHTPAVMGIPLYYDSVSAASSSFGGRGWSLGLPRLSVTGSQAQIVEGGRTTVFQLVSGSWVSPPGETRKLVATGGSTFELRAAGGTHKLVFQSGRMTEERNAYRALAQWTYDGAGRPTLVTDPRTGESATLHYDFEGRLEHVTRGGLQQTLGYDWDGQLSSISLPHQVGGWSEGDEARYTYGGGIMTSASAANGDTTWYTAGSDGGLLSVRYADTYAVVYTCESGPSGAITYRMTDSFGQAIEQTNVASGQVLSTADAYGNLTSYAWNGSGQLTSRSADGQTEQWSFRADGALLGYTNPLGQTTSYAYSGERLISETDHLSRTTAYGYDANGFVNAITDPLGRTTSIINNPQGDAVQSTAPGGLVSKRTINAAGDVTSETGPDNRTISYAVNAAGRVTGVQYPDGTSESYTYRPNGQIATEVARDGRATSYTYDARDRLINVALPGGRNIATDFDHLGRPVRVTKNLGQRPQIEERGYGLNGVLAWSRRNGMMDQAGPRTFWPLGMPPATPITAGPGAGSGSGGPPPAMPEAPMPSAGSAWTP